MCGARSARGCHAFCAIDVHPEFGYFCPTSSLYHELRLVLFSALFGAVIGGGVIALSARLGRNTDTEITSPPAAKAAPLPGADDISRGGTDKKGSSSVNVTNAEASDADTARQRPDVTISTEGPAGTLGLAPAGIETTSAKLGIDLPTAGQVLRHEQPRGCFGRMQSRPARIAQTWEPVPESDVENLRCDQTSTSSVMWRTS